MTAPAPVTITLPPAVLTEYRHSGHPEEGAELFPASAWEECPGCGKGFEEDQLVRKLDGRWTHEDCAIRSLTTGSADDAWLTLAGVIAARPSAFRASDIKAVLTNVAAIARRGHAA
jgi:hypothetical protein